MNDASFLSAIAAKPTDAQLRLAYADWLEEQRDPRAELIRLEEQSRTLPAWDDRCWNSRARRYELQRTLPQDWLNQLGYQRCYRPLFDRPLPADRADRWRLMHTFLETWHGLEVSARPRGVEPAEIAALEERLGMPAPAAIREFYAEAGRQLSYWSRQDKTFAINELRPIARPTQFPGIEVRVADYLEDYENQACARWYVPTDTGLIDPPVRSIQPGTREPETETCTTFSEFAVFTLVLESMWHGEVRSEQFGPFEDLLPWIGPHTGLSRCQLAGDYWVLGKVNLIEGIDVRLTHCPPDGYLFVTARTEAAYEALPADLRAGLT
jgi:uncharacterized protein (TIGR02996 family)